MNATITAAICVGIAIILFVCFIAGYKEGLRLGMKSAKGIEPKRLDPIGEVKKAKEKKAEDKELAEKERVFDAFENYDGYTEREKAWMKGGKA